MSSSTVDRDIQILADPDRLKRKNALKRLLDAATAPEAGAWEAPRFKALTTECLRRFEDSAEGCRELAINIVAAIVPLQRADVMDYVLPSIAARIGTEPIREESEELRLRLLDVALLCLDTFPHDLGNFIDFYPVILANCVSDAYPELKRKACTACMRLCEVEPKRVKSSALMLGKAVKIHALNHKHAVVRCEAIKAFGVLLEHGAADMLGDMRDEQDNQTTVYALYQLANDRADAVRSATLAVLSKILLDISERHDQPRRVLPFVLSLLTDPIEDIRRAARLLMTRLGNLYEVDHADNRVDLDKRRITIKDIEWYADDAFPDMSLSIKSTASFPDLNDRPTLGARHAVAEHVRNFLDELLKDATGVNWTIPHSMNNKRTVALRTLAMIIVYCESNIVQYAQQILQTLYKVVRDDDKEVQTEGLVCAELMGKFMTTDQYLPFLVAQSSDEEDGSTKRVDGKRVVTLLNMDGSPSVGSSALPTLFSTAGTITKASILTVMRLLLLGARRTLTVDQAKMIVKALTDPNLQNLEAPELMKNLISVQLSTCMMLIDRGFVVAEVAPEAPRTLDSMLAYSILTATACEDASVVRAADAALEAISTRLLGSRNGLYQLHFGRWIQRHLKTMPPEGLTRLIENTPSLTAHSQFIVDLFCARLEKIQYNLRIQAELQFFNILKSVTASHRLEFTSEQLETLLRLVVLPQLQFQPGPTPHLFRKVAFATLAVLLDPFHRNQIKAALHDDDGALSEKITALWLNGTDSDDVEIRWSCVQCFEHICILPLRAGTASDVIDHIMLGFNDSSDELRLAVAKQLRGMLYSGNDICRAIIDAVFTKLGTVVKTLLVHLDDHMEGIGIRDEICAILKRLKGVNAEFVQTMVQQVRTKHHTTKYCDAILEFEPNR